MTSLTKLLPCPFCGTPPLSCEVYIINRPAWTIFCHVGEKCAADVSVTAENEAEALKLWNTRAGFDAATVERCAQVAIRLNGWGSPPRPDIAEHIASAIRSLITNSAGTPGSSHRGSPSGESDPAVTQDCAPAGADTYDAMAAIQSGVMKVVHPSPSQPVAGLTEEERSSLRRVKYLLDHNTKGFLPGYGNMVNITVSVTDAKIASAHLDRLTSSPVSEEELAKAIYDATPFPDLGGGPLHWSHVSREIKDRYRLRARALLNQFSIGRK